MGASAKYLRAPWRRDSIPQGCGRAAAAACGQDEEEGRGKEGGTGAAKAGAHADVSWVGVGENAI